jgi:pimeloyl-ACP methyl ester carboxylesterase
VDVFVPVDDTTGLHVRQWEGSADPPFLLLHGLDSNARMWDLVAARLAAARHPVYAIDQRGHGESDAAGGEYDNATAAADTAAVAAALGVDGAVIAGHSWGALLALRLAAERPGLTAAIALIEGGWAHAGSVLDSWEQFTGLLAKDDGALKGATLDSVRAYYRVVYPDWPQESIEAVLHSLRVNEDGSLTQRLPPAQREAIMRSIWNDPPARWFSSVKVPAMLMPAIPRPERRWEFLFTRMNACVGPTASALSGATVREYLGGDHDLHAQHPDRVAADLLSLAGQVRAG